MNSDLLDSNGTVGPYHNSNKKNINGFYVANSKNGVMLRVKDNSLRQLNDNYRDTNNNSTNSKGANSVNFNTNNSVNVGNLLENIKKQNHY